MKASAGRRLPQLAVAYDFDGTLCDAQMQDYGLLPRLGLGQSLQIRKFWEESNALAASMKADRVCAYMHMLLARARQRGIALTERLLAECGKDVKVREGLAGSGNWFERIGKLGRDRGLDVRHYVISSGLGEIIRGTGIAKWFAGRPPAQGRIFASRYLYDPDSGEAVAPAWVVNYTTKTQFLFRINKGLLDLGEENAVNRYVPERKRPVPFANIVFIGDGFTDIPCFRLVKQLGGHALAVTPGSARDLHAVQRKFSELVNDGRVDGISLGDHFARRGVLEILLERVMDGLAEKAR